MNFSELLSPEEHSAITVLMAGGFQAFTDARLADVRELGTGRRQRTFRNRGRYDLVFAIRKLESREMPPPVNPTDQALDPALNDRLPGLIVRNSIGTAADLKEAYPELCKQLIDEALTSDSAEQPEQSEPPAPAVPLNPVEEMTVPELRTEARNYPEIIGEHRMNKAELQQAVQAHRDRRDLLHRSFPKE